MNEGRRTTVRRWFGPGRVLWRPAPSVHRLELPPIRPAWTLVFTGAKQREWCFRTLCAWVPWFRDAREEGGRLPTVGGDLFRSTAA